MHFSEHYVIFRQAARRITLAQAEEAVNNPAETELQPDGRVRYWGYVPELNHYIRVVVDLDGETIITTHIDSRFRPREE